MPGTPLIRLLAILLIVQPLMGVDCYKDRPGCHSFLGIQNNGSKAIYFSLAFDSSLARLNYPPGNSPENYKCNAGTTGFLKSRGCLEGMTGSSGNIFIFLFDSDVIEGTSWETVKQNRMLLASYSLSIPQLDSLGWTIRYP